MGLCCLVHGQRVKVELFGCLAVKARLRPVAVVELEVTGEAVTGQRDRLVGLEIHLLVLHRFPQPLDEHVVAPGAFAVHADADVLLFQESGEVAARELAALIRPE